MPRVVKVSSFLLLAGSLLLPACRNDVSSPTSESVPALEAGAATAVSTPLSSRQVSVGASHTCGVTTDDRAYCWGSNGDGQLGIGRPVSNPDGDFSTAPIAVAGGFRFLWVDAGTDFACGLATDERAYCWGANGLAQLGDNTRTSRSLPTAVRGGRRFRQLRSGHTHTCGVTYADVVFCWGDNSSGQLGDGTFHALRVPVQVIGGVRFRQVLTGGLHTCAMTQADQGYCWGNNDFGQLGRRHVHPTTDAGSNLGRPAVSPSERWRHAQLRGHGGSAGVLLGQRPSWGTGRWHIRSSFRAGPSIGWASLHQWGERGESTHLWSDQQQHRVLLGEQWVGRAGRRDPDGSAEADQSRRRPGFPGACGLTLRVDDLRSNHGRPRVLLGQQLPRAGRERATCRHPVCAHGRGRTYRMTILGLRPGLA